MSFSVKHLNYLQGLDNQLGPPVLEGPATVAQAAFWRLLGVGRTEKQIQADPEQRVHLSSEDLLTGLHSLKIPVALLLLGDTGSVKFHLGTWIRRTDNPSQDVANPLRDQQEALRACLQSLFPAVDLVEAAVNLPTFPMGGLVTGVPTIKPPDPLDRALPLDRLIRGLTGIKWGCMVLAEPVAESDTNKIRLEAIAEMKSIQSETAARGIQEPLAGYYSKLLESTLVSLTSALAVGLWRTGVYLLADDSSYARLAAVWQGIFSGSQSAAQVMRVSHYREVAHLAANWTLPDTRGEKGPGIFNYPLKYQTLLGSDQLAAYIHVPNLETGGFEVQPFARFDVVPTSVDREEPAQVGKIVSPEKSFEQDYAKLAESFYEVGLNALTKHVLIAGVTGAGKTTTIFNLLKKVSTLNVPFLVIEPAKTEYRDLLTHPDIGARLQIFTLGNEQLSPFRLNPFEVLSGTPISVHIDYLKSVFSVSFGLWNPLPQILEECLYLIYQDKGWDITADVNRRTKSRDDPRAFPTLSDFLAKIDEVTSRLQWDPEAMGRIRGSLRDRLRSLRNGGKGRMLDVQRSIPMETLLDHPTVLELESLGDDDDKAFIMGLLLIRLVEYRRSFKDTPQVAPKRLLKHLLIVEEAHRLLTNVVMSGEEGASNPRAKAVEAFANMLSEIRAYGQGVVIADQVPVKLARDVIKNTNLKIVHRIVDVEDRKVLAGAMAMNEDQSTVVSTLIRGRAAVFSEGDDAPLLVQIPPPKRSEGKVSAATVRTHMAGSAVLASHADLFAAHPGCVNGQDRGGASCEAARVIVEDHVFQRDFNRLILSVIDDPESFDRLWFSLERRHVDAAMDVTMEDKDLLAKRKEMMLHCLRARAAEWFAARRGSQTGWSYEDTHDLSKKIRQALSEKLVKEKQFEAVEALRNCLRKLHVRQLTPFSHCEKICNQQSPLCLYRQAVTDVVEKGDFTTRWNETNPLNAPTKTASWAVCQRVAEQLVEWNLASQQDAIRRIGLCYGQMMLKAEAAKVTPEFSDTVFESLRQEAEQTRLNE